jgi:hypothetical protein
MDSLDRPGSCRRGVFVIDVGEADPWRCEQYDGKEVTYDESGAHK